MTAEGNKIIAEFDLHIKTSEIRYDKSWNRLMPVVEKINKTWEYTNLDGDEFLPAEQIIHVLRISLGNVDINNVWLAVVAFIKWYNSQDKK